MPRVVLAFDKFRGSATASELVEAALPAVAGAGWSASIRPMADGGEGSLDVLGGANRTTRVRDPLGNHVEAAWRMSGCTAYIEMARASGLDLVGGPEQNDALAADTFGVGQLIGSALDHGATKVVVFLGGSATTDGGAGALRALPSKAVLKQAELVIACDVETKFCDAAEVFGAQKGASPAQVKMLRRRLESLQQTYSEEYGVDVSTTPGAGAAGGLAGGLMALGGTIASGFDVLADAVEFGAECAGADLVITGEGFLDDQSFGGKVVGGVVRWAAAEAVPTVSIVGGLDDGVVVPQGLQVVSLSERFGVKRSYEETASLVAEVVAELLVAHS